MADIAIKVECKVTSGYQLIWSAPQGTRIPVAREGSIRGLRCVAHQSCSESHSKGGKSTGGRGRQHKEAEVPQHFRAAEKATAKGRRKIISYNVKSRVWGQSHSQKLSRSLNEWGHSRANNRQLRSGWHSWQ